MYEVKKKEKRSSWIFVILGESYLIFVNKNNRWRFKSKLVILQSLLSIKILKYTKLLQSLIAFRKEIHKIYKYLFILWN